MSGGRRSAAGPGARAPRVSVVTPTWNRATLLPATIESVLAQTFGDFEYLVVDDGSTDDTERVVRRYGERVAYCRHDNAGEAESTNRGWRLARGEYFAFLSSDDPVMPIWLEETVRFLDARPDVLLAYPDWRVIDEEGTPLQEMTTYEYSFRNMVGWFHTTPGPGALIRKAALPDWAALRDPAYRYAPDLECYWRLALRGPFARVPRTLASWRRHPGSITIADRSLARAREMVRLAERFFARGDVPAEVRAVRRYARSRAAWVAAWVLLESHPLRSALHLRRSYALAADDPPELPPGLRRLPRPTLRDLCAAALRAGRGARRPG